jgi:hypothetical protein
MIHTSRTACWPEIRIDNHGLATPWSEWHKSATVGEIWPLMQDEAGNAPPQQVELMLALRLGIAGMLGEGGGGEGGKDGKQTTKSK